MSHMLFIIGDSSELLGLSSSLELWFCILFRLFGVVLVNFPVGRFTRTIISVSPVHVSSVSVDNPSPPCAPIHENAPFCGRDAEGGLAIPSSAPRRGWCGRHGGSARGRPGGRWRRRGQWRGTRTSPSRGWWQGRTMSAS